MPGRKRSILIVDTDAYLAGIYGRRFEAGGWHVRVAEGAEEMKKALARRIPVAILLDVETIPEALELLKNVRKNPKTAQCTLVALASIGNRSRIEQAKRAGADAYLLKGHFVPSEVVEKVERLIE